MHPDVETMVVSFSGEMPDEINEMLNEWQDETAEYIQQEAERLNISFMEMSDIFYLRTRSRWTQEKEDYLIKLAHEGKPFPDILSGEF